MEFSRSKDIAVLVLAHANPGVFERLVRALSHPSIAIFCHIDAKADLAAFRTQSCASVVFLEERVDINWGGYSMIEAELALFRAARRAGPFAAYAVISGDCLPLFDNAALVASLASTPHTLLCQLQLPKDNNYLRLERIFLPDTSIGSFRGKRYFERYLDPADFPLIERAMAIYRNPERLKIAYYKSSQWFSVSDELLARMFDYLAGNPLYEEIFRFTAMPDEAFFPTLLNIIQPAAKRHYALVDVDWTRQPLPYVMQALSDFDVVSASRSPFYRKFTDACLTLVDKVIETRRSAEQVAAFGAGEVSRIMARSQSQAAAPRGPGTGQ
jgi:hypothetical protein